MPGMKEWLVWPFRFVFALGLESSAHRLMEAHEWREAAEVYRRLIDWAPRQATFHAEAGLAHLMLHQWEPAEDRLREAVRLDPRALRAREFLGLLLANQGRLEDAAEQFTRLIQAAQDAAARGPWFLRSFHLERATEAEERLAALRDPEFAGFPVDPGYAEYPGALPGAVDPPKPPPSPL